MVKRVLAAAMTLLLFVSPALGEVTVESSEGEMYFPQEKNWTYHFLYAYPHIVGEDYTSALINDTYEMALDEMTQLVLPMFANAKDMRYDGQNEVRHGFSVQCNNGRVLSILQTREQTRGAEGDLYALEPLTFDVGGMYAGETLTLRGVTLIQAGVDSGKLEEVTAEDYPALAHIIDGSSVQMGEALLPVLYQEFQKLQESGRIAPQWTYDDYEDEFSPTRDFYTNDEGSILFFFPPMLLSAPSFDVPVFSFTPEELDAIAAVEEM